MGKVQPNRKSVYSARVQSFTRVVWHWFAKKHCPSYGLVLWGNPPAKRQLNQMSSISRQTVEVESFGQLQKSHGKPKDTDKYVREMKKMIRSQETSGGPEFQAWPTSTGVPSPSWQSLYFFTLSSCHHLKNPTGIFSLKNPFVPWTSVCDSLLFWALGLSQGK